MIYTANRFHTLYFYLSLIGTCLCFPTALLHKVHDRQHVSLQSCLQICLSPDTLDPPHLNLTEDLPSNNCHLYDC